MEMGVELQGWASPRRAEPETVASEQERMMVPSLLLKNSAGNAHCSSNPLPACSVETLDMLRIISRILNTGREEEPELYHQLPLAPAK